MKKVYILAISILLGLTLNVYADNNFFKDVSEKDWFYNYVKDVSEKGLMNGYEDKFRPHDYVTRAELAKVVSEVTVKNTVIEQGDNKGFETKVLNTVANTLPISVTINADGKHGSGIMLDGETILTAEHVTGGNMTVEMVDGSERMAFPLKKSDKYDLALIGIRNENEVEGITLAKDVSVGETAIAIGSPFRLDFTVSKGIVSYLDRKLYGNSYLLMQVDTPLNSGNSGGAIVNLEGELIGIAESKIVIEDLDESINNLSFAVRLEDIREFLNENYYNQ